MRRWRCGRPTGSWPACAGSLEEVGKELAIQFGPVLEAVGHFLVGVAEQAGKLVSNFRQWLPYIGAVAGALVGLIVILKLAALAQAALAIATVVGAPFGVTALALLGIGVGATIAGAGAGTMVAGNIGRDINRLEREMAEQKLTEAEVKRANVDALREATNQTPFVDRRNLRALARTYRDEPARRVGTPSVGETHRYRSPLLDGGMPAWAMPGGADGTDESYWREPEDHDPFEGRRPFGMGRPPSGGATGWTLWNGITAALVCPCPNRKWAGPRRPRPPRAGNL